MAENTLQFKWIVLVKEGLETLFRHDPERLRRRRPALVSGRG